MVIGAKYRDESAFMPRKLCSCLLVNHGLTQDQCSTCIPLNKKKIVIHIKSIYNTIQLNLYVVNVGPKTEPS